MSDTHGDVLFKYYDHNRKTVIKAFSPYNSRGWQSVEFPVFPDKILIEPKNRERYGYYDYILQVESGDIGIKNLLPS